MISGCRRAHPPLCGGGQRTGEIRLCRFKPMQRIDPQEIEGAGGAVVKSLPCLDILAVLTFELP